MKRITHLLAGALLGLTACQGSLIVFFLDQGPPGGGPNGGTAYTYDIDVTSGTTVRSGIDYFVIYDFGPVLGLAVNDFVAPDWQVASLNNVGPTPAGQTPSDSAQFQNIQIRYTGAADITGPAFTGIDDLTFTLESPTATLINATLNASSSYFDSEQNEPSSTTFDLPIPLNEVPEPATMGLLAAGLAGLGLLRRGRRR